MKHALILIFILSLGRPLMGQDIQTCIPDGIEVTTQVQIDNFPVDYPGCNTILGNVKISGIDIVNLSGLSQIQTIIGNLEIADNTQLQRLTGLEQLDSIYGTFNIVRNPSLQIIDALDSLKFVGGFTFTISDNASLTTIESLENIDHLGGSLRVIQNNVLTSVTGFQNVRIIDGNLSIASNPELTSISSLGVDSIRGNCFITECGLDNLDYLAALRIIKGGFLITNNPKLTSLTGANALQSIGGLTISSNALLASGIGFENLISIGADLTVRNNPVLTGLQFASRLDSLPGRLIIHTNGVLNNLTGLDLLRVIDSDVLIRNNAKLQSLQGLDSLTIIRGTITLLNNEVLEDIDAFSQVNPVEVNDITIENSPLLSECAVESICEFIANGGPSLFANNATGCNSIEEVSAACLVGVQYSSKPDEISIFPNPTSGRIFFKTGISDPVLIRVFDSQGREILKLPGVTDQIDLSHLKTGLYFLILGSGQETLIARVFKT